MGDAKHVCKIGNGDIPRSPQVSKIPLNISHLSLHNGAHPKRKGLFARQNSKSNSNCCSPSNLSCNSKPISTKSHYIPPTTTDAELATKCKKWSSQSVVNYNRSSFKRENSSHKCSPTSFKQSASDYTFCHDRSLIPLAETFSRELVLPKEIKKQHGEHKCTWSYCRSKSAPSSANESTTSLDEKVESERNGSTRSSIAGTRVSSRPLSRYQKCSKSEPYVPLCELQQNLKRGEFIEGLLRVNKCSYEDSFIHAPILLDARVL